MKPKFYLVNFKLKTGKYCLMSLSLFLALILSSCDIERFYERYSDIPEYQWHYHDSIPFKVKIEDTSSVYDLYFNIRHTGNYNFRNIWVNIHLKNPSGEFNSNRYEFTLSEPSGKWYGKGIGGIYDAQYPFRKKFRFREIGEHTIYIQHLMRNDVLNDVMNVGIRIDKVR